MVREFSLILDILVVDIINKLEKVGYKLVLLVRIILNMDCIIFVVLVEKVGDIRGVEICIENICYYFYDSLVVYLLGYIGEVIKEELIVNFKYLMGMIVGKMGIECLVNFELEGVWGNCLIEVDVKGNEI